ncbi:MAG: hypothetical protein KA154_04575 [Gemmatimonadaceae bacterium]|nr:hypothetical protein [Gemmatimonadaceae bacterium]MCC6431058.1 hypothetical protein [Gemmatimonadaceae bacterium]
MVLTKAELITALQNEVRILLHLAGKFEPASLDYRPTPKQRSGLELLQYLTYMGPCITRDTLAGEFDPVTWTAYENAAAARDFEATVAELEKQSDLYATILGDVPDEHFRTEAEMFGQTATRGVLLVSNVLSGYAAYRTQLFLYLKSCGRTELDTWNLWAGMDAPAQA